MFLNPRNVDFRNHIVDHIVYSPEVADFWRYEFLRQSPEQQMRLEAALTRINTLLTNPYVRAIVGQQKTTLNFETFLTLPTILLFKLSSNLPEDAKNFIGTILLNELVWAVRNRPEDERSQFCIFIDEFHNFASTDHMATLSTEGRKYVVAPTYMHVERFGQLAHNQKLMGATAAIVNKGLFQTTVNNAEEFAPEFAKRVEPSEIHREAELIISPHPVEDIWDRGHPNQLIMDLRQDYFWIVDVLRNRPTEKYFLFDPSRVPPENLKHNPLEFNPGDFADQDYYRVSADMLHSGIAVMNEYFYNWMRGKYDPNEVITDEQVELLIRMVEYLGGIYGFMPMLKPYIPNEKRERLLYLMNEKRKQNYEEERRNKIQTARAEIQHLKEHGVREELVYFPKNIRMTTIIGVNVSLPTNEKRKLLVAQNEYLERLSKQILSLEQGQPPQYTSLPSSIALCQDINEIKTVAIQAGMPSHEVEEFIEWELSPLTPEEKTALKESIVFIAHIMNVKDGIDKYGHKSQQMTINYCDAMANRHHAFRLQTQAARNRMDWQNIEKGLFISAFVGLYPRILAQDPIKVPSGKYVETLRVERTQQDLNNDMVSDLSTLPRRHAYVKIMQETGNVATHKITTKELPPPKESDIETLVRLAGYDFCKKREDIQAEIRDRQSRWQGGSGPPSQTKRIR